MRLAILTPDSEAGSRSGPTSPLAGALGPRSIESVRVLRLSITDRCNFRCVYCMPPEGVAWLDRENILTFEEIADVCRAARDHHGISRFKLTGGEPTVRRELPTLVRMLRNLDPDDLSLTTNGMLLEGLARPLFDAGLDRVTISLDSLQPDRFARITRTGDLATVLRGIETALAVGFGSVKLNCVTMRGTNDDELADFAALTLRWPVTVRFIEYMPLGEAAILGSRDRVDSGSSLVGPAHGCGDQDRGREALFSESAARQRIESVLGPLEPIDQRSEPGVGPAKACRLARPDAVGRIGFISAMSAPFCATCNRLRLTADGVLRSCLFDAGEVDIRPILRDLGLSAARRQSELADAMERCVRLKPGVHSAYGQDQMSRIGG